MEKGVVRLALAVTLGLAGLSGCSSGSSSSSENQRVSGAITGFGSVYVNGIRYDTGRAALTSDGAVASEQDLAVGMVVTLRGRVNPDSATGIADAIDFRDDLEGIVLATQVSPGSGAGTLDIMGQTVTATTTTVIESRLSGITTLDQIASGHMVEVSGFGDGTGNIIATRLEVKKNYTPGDELEVKGVVADLDADNKRFRLGALWVDYSGAHSVPSRLRDGLYVEVKSTAAPQAHVLVATKVDVEGNGVYGLQASEGEKVEVQGVVTSIDSASGSFTLNGQAVTIGGNANVVNALLDQLVIGSMIKIEARMTNGFLVLKKFEHEDEGDIEFSGSLSAIDVGSATVTVLGEPVRLTAKTIMRDKRDANGAVPLHYFGITDLAVGDYVEVVAFRTADGRLIATELKRDNDHGAGYVSLQGTVDSLNAESMVVAGFTVHLTGATIPGDLAVGAKVALHGTFDGQTVNAQQIKSD